MKAKLTLPISALPASAAAKNHVGWGKDPKRRRSTRRCAVILGVALSMIPQMQQAQAGGMAPLLLQADGQITVVRPDENSAVTFSTVASEHALASLDGKLVATTKPGPNETTILEIRDPWTATTNWTQTIPGSLRVEAISGDGRNIVLGDANISATAASVPKGRTTTRLVLVGEGVGHKVVTLPGNFVAEAFLSKGQGVALIEHLPPTDPKSYRVRPLSFYGGEQALLRPIGGLKAGLTGTPRTEQMQGVRLNQTWNNTGDGLYTLYDSTDYPHGEGVFVHALDLTTGLARCLDVPSDIEAGVGKGKVVFTGTGKLIVAGRKGIVRMDIKTGAVEQKLRVQMKSVGALFSQADKAYVSDGRTLHEYQVSTLKKLNSKTFTSPIVAGTIEGQMPPIVVDAKGAIWYVTNDPILRGTYKGPIANDVEVIAQQ
jgi:hypothetical protein